MGEASNGVDVFDMASQQPDVVLMDLKMPGGSGVQATRAIVDRYPTVRVLVLTTYAAPEMVLDAIRTGAAGYLLKDTTRERLVEAIRGTAAGGTHVVQRRRTAVRPGGSGARGRHDYRHRGRSHGASGVAYSWLETRTWVTGSPGDLRILIGIDDGGLRASFRPLTTTSS